MPTLNLSLHKNSLCMCVCIYDLFTVKACVQVDWVQLHASFHQLYYTESYSGTSNYHACCQFYCKPLISRACLLFHLKGYSTSVKTGFLFPHKQAKPSSLFVPSQHVFRALHSMHMISCTLTCMLQENAC